MKSSQRNILSRLDDALWWTGIPTGLPMTCPTTSVTVAFCALMLNATLLGTLPTLYASWHFRQLPNE